MESYQRNVNRREQDPRRGEMQGVAVGTDFSRFSSKEMCLFVSGGQEARTRGDLSSELL